MKTEHLLNLAEVAQRLDGISLRSVRRLIASETLPKPIKVLSVPMIAASEFDEFLERAKAQRQICMP